ncbi:helix-turn-helix domain-containing protein [Ornithinimicrobium cryptoxanthini]|uniref:Helix-turn-helix domain-containing protein n=1 Tax=Ornithinimicrobium cryptoxanthini TaxID=2934161 RepID=A0ABY4YM32_9MICO|nr:helix-turn-helix domain-containing protein [Ornithinimicrobium cryptoxanthini]USQ77776.1 helix-turn-helix domain-containing protein [Ornithinimicrobium cryptoxanthini]
MSERTSTPLMPRELWTAPQLADYLGKPLKYVYRLTHERRIDHYVIGRELRFDPEHVRSFLDEAHYAVHVSDETAEQAPETATVLPRIGRPRGHRNDRHVT